jgi:hypothetical protein
MATTTTRRTAKANAEAIETLRRNGMMAHLLDALDDNKDIGHYGRFVFATVARHFLSEDDLLGLLARDEDFSEGEARRLVQDVNERDYSPPGRDKILEFQSKQDFSILPDTDDPDAGNVYRDLEFPDRVYEHISEYREEQEAANG